VSSGECMDRNGERPAASQQMHFATISTTSACKTARHNYSTTLWDPEARASIDRCWFDVS